MCGNCLCVWGHKSSSVRISKLLVLHTPLDGSGDQRHLVMLALTERKFLPRSTRWTVPKRSWDVSQMDNKEVFG